MVVVLIPNTSQPYGRLTHPVGKSYAINIEAEKMGFYLLLYLFMVFLKKTTREGAKNGHTNKDFKKKAVLRKW